MTFFVTVFWGLGEIVTAAVCGLVLLGSRVWDSVSQRVAGARFELRWVAPPATDSGVHVLYEGTDFGCITFRK